MKPYTLTNREGESISPMTSTKTVFDEKGVDLDTLLLQQRQDGENALKEYAKKTEVTRDLSGKQDKLSTTTDLHITDDNIIGLTEKGSRKMFDEMFLEMAGEYGTIDYSHFENNVHKPYCLNELWLTYEEVKRSMMYPLRVVSNYMGEYYADVDIRTNICYPHIWFTQINCQNFANQCRAEVLRFPPKFQPTSSSGMFVNCGNLKKVLGPIYPIQPATHLFYGSSTHKLEYIELILREDVDLSQASKLTIECIEYLIAKAVNTKTITIAVHPDVYEKLTDTNNTEWYAQLTAGAAKNISFATI